MQSSVIYRASELTAEERQAAAVLLGHDLGEDEMVSVRVSKGRLLHEGVTGEARQAAFGRLWERVEQTAQRSEGTPDDEIEAAIQEAVTRTISPRK